MSETPRPDKSPRFPRLALITVAVGLLASIAILLLAHLPGGSTKDVSWDTREEIKVPPARTLGKDGSLELSATSISALAPNISNESLYMIAGGVRVDSGKDVNTAIQCDIAGDGQLVLDDDKNPIEETTIARTPKLRAAWPRPSGESDLKIQPVPELLTVKFNALGADVLNLPIREYFRRYTDSTSPVTVDWDTDSSGTRQSFIWKLPEGTGVSTASLSYAVVFKTVVKPTGSLKCSATAGKEKSVARAPFKQVEWPVISLNDGDAAAASSQDAASSGTDVQ